MARLDDGARRLLEEGEALARRMHHHHVDIEHLAYVALTDRALAGHSPLGTSRPELTARLAARLDSLPRAAVYRDGRDQPRPSARVDAAIRRAGRLRPRWIFQAVRVTELFEALLADPQVAPIVASSAMLDGELAAVLEQATSLAASRHHAMVAVEHVLLVLLESTFFVETLGALDVTSDHIRTQLEASLADEPTTEHRGPPPPAFGLARAVRVAKGYASLQGRASVGGRDFISALSRSSDHRPMFERWGIARARLLRALFGRPLVDDDPADVPDDALEIVFINDDFTTFEVVLDILVSCIGLTRQDAFATANAIHVAGAAVVATLPSAEARARVAEARRRAEDEGMPLRIDLLRVGGGDAEDDAVERDDKHRSTQAR